MANEENNDLLEALRCVGLVPGQPVAVCQAIETLRHVKEPITQSAFIERISHTSSIHSADLERTSTACRV